MNKLLAMFATIIFITSGQAMACEKWKSEIGSAAFYIGSYISTYNKFNNAKISKSQLSEKSDELIEKLRHIKARLKLVPSCDDDHDKFKKRAEALTTALEIAIPTMKAGDFLAEEVRAELKRHEAN